MSKFVTERCPWPPPNRYNPPILNNHIQPSSDSLQASYEASYEAPYRPNQAETKNGHTLDHPSQRVVAPSALSQRPQSPQTRLAKASHSNVLGKTLCQMKSIPIRKSPDPEGLQFLVDWRGRCIFLASGQPIGVKAMTQDDDFETYIGSSNAIYARSTPVPPNRDDGLLKRIATRAQRSANSPALSTASLAPENAQNKSGRGQSQPPSVQIYEASPRTSPLKKTRMGIRQDRASSVAVQSDASIDSAQVKKRKSKLSVQTAEQGKRRNRSPSLEPSDTQEKLAKPSLKRTRSEEVLKKKSPLALTVDLPPLPAMNQKVTSPKRAQANSGRKPTTDISNLPLPLSEPTESKSRALHVPLGESWDLDLFTSDLPEHTMDSNGRLKKARSRSKSPMRRKETET